MSSIEPSKFAGWLSASFHLFRISARRLIWSRQTLICAALLSLVAVAVVAWGAQRDRSPGELIEDILLTVYVPFLLPVFCLTYATAGVATEREEQTLVYLLVTPLPRALVFVAKFGASYLLALAWTIGALALVGALLGDAGIEVFGVLWTSVFCSTTAYVALFSLFSVLFRRATILALVYALFLEVLAGSMPGIVKRVAISYYTRSMILDASSEFDVDSFASNSFDLIGPIAGSTAESVLWILSAALLILGAIAFSTREYAR